MKISSVYTQFIQIIMIIRLFCW